MMGKKTQSFGQDCVIPAYERLLAMLMIVAYVVLALGFSLGPILETPDEARHYRFIKAISRSWALPDPYTEPDGETHQAPLYYALIAPVAALLDDADFPTIAQRVNPYLGHGFRTAGNDNKNLFLHSRTERFPYEQSETARTIHLLRLFSVAMGTGTVITCYAILRLLWPDRPDRRLAALGFVAFLPQFAYLSSGLMNDNLLFLLASITLWLLLRQAHDGLTWPRALILGVVLGAALLTKLNALFLAIPVGVTFLLDRRTWRYILPAFVAVLAVAGWWYGRNAVLYGDPTLMNVYFDLWPSEVLQPGELSWDVELGRLLFAYQTFWARFGHNTVPMGQWIYVFFNVLTFAAGIGLAIWVGRHLPEMLRQGIGDVRIRRAIILGMFALTWIVSLIYASTQARQFVQGRFLLPGIAAWGALVALGFDVWTPRRIRMQAALGGSVVMASMVVVCMLGYFFPAYRVLPISGEIEHPLSYRYGDVAELIGVSSVKVQAQPGEVSEITLYWRALKPTDVSLIVSLCSVDTEIVRRESVPGTGNLLSTEWLPGETWAERYVLAIPYGWDEVLSDSLVVGLYDPISGWALPVTDEAGNPVQPVVGQIVVSAPVGGVE